MRMNIPGWTVTSIALVAASWLVFDHRRLRNTSDFVKKLRLAEIRGMGSEAPQLLEHLYSGVAYAMAAYLFVQFLLMLESVAHQSYGMGMKMRPGLVLSVVLALAGIAFAFHDRAFSFVNYIAGAFTIAVAARFAIFPVGSLAWIARHPLVAICGVAGLIWTTLNVSWEVKELIDGTSNLMSSAEQLSASLGGVAVTVAFIGLLGRRKSDGLPALSQPARSDKSAP